jgi:hypothetical protein
MGKTTPFSSIRVGLSYHKEKARLNLPRFLTPLLKPEQVIPCLIFRKGYHPLQIHFPLSVDRLSAPPGFIGKNPTRLPPPDTCTARKDEALLKMLYLVTMDVLRKWTGRVQHRGQILLQLSVFFEDRVQPYSPIFDNEKASSPKSFSQERSKIKGKV